MEEFCKVNEITVFLHVFFEFLKYYISFRLYMEFYFEKTTEIRKQFWLLYTLYGIIILKNLLYFILTPCTVLSVLLMKSIDCHGSVRGESHCNLCRKEHYGNQ